MPKTSDQLVADFFATQNNPKLIPSFMKDVQAVDDSVLFDALAQMTTEPQKSAANLKATREAVLSGVQRRNTERLVRTLDKVDRSTRFLTWIIILLTLIGVAFPIWEHVQQAKDKPLVTQCH